MTDETGPAASASIRGMQLYAGFLDHPAQAALVDALRDVIRVAPLFSPMTPYGKPMSVQLTSAGQFGWVSDRKGYRYSETHPRGGAWPPIPGQVLDIWRAVSGSARDPECCLVNFYADGARMGMHQDRDEADFSEPVLSISLGDSALFRVGNLTRGGKTESVWLHSGDVVVFGGEARLLYHGIDRIKPNTSPLLKHGGRINLTLRVVT